MHNQPLRNSVKIWLWTGLVMLFFQIIIGGITRLTGSGLSITKWEIVTGAIPPLNARQWDEAFNEYKATPQYQKINQGMTAGQFKWIYFWEYLHRLWARSMGFVFLIPLIYFWFKGYLSSKLKKDLIVVFFLAGIVGAFGWIMVASGLVDRPWVNAYKLTLHLGLALLTMSYLWWAYLKTGKYLSSSDYVHHQKPAKNLLILISIQILLGGMMSGMKAALMYPNFPKMNQDWWIDPIIFQASSWKLIHFIDYDRYAFLPALVQVLHRFTAFLILFLFLQILFKSFHLPLIRYMGFLLILQIVLGILTLLNSIGSIPIFWGIAHQAVAILLLMSGIKCWYLARMGRYRY